MGPGQLQRQSGEAGRRWRTFHYALPLACPPCQLGFAVGPFRMAASSPPAPAGGAENGSAAANGKKAAPAAAKQLTHFAPPQLPAELAVAAVLAAPPAVSPAANGGGSSAAADGLARSAHFLGLVWGLYEEVLGAACPLPTLQQAFLPPELLLGSGGTVAAGLQMLPTSQLIQPRAIEQSSACGGWACCWPGACCELHASRPQELSVAAMICSTPCPILPSCCSRGAVRHGALPGTAVVWRAAAGGLPAGRVAGGG